jgi:hypothetical protein
MDFDYWWLLPLAIIPAFGILVVGIAWWEKHPIRPFAVPEEGKEPPETNYAKRMNDDAEDEGYVFLGLAGDNRGKLYRLRFDFWGSEDNTVFIVVAGGKLARIPYKGLLILSALPGGRYLTTTDDIGTVDLSGLGILQIFPNASFRKLIDKHLARLEELVGDEALPFPSDNPLRSYIKVREQQAARLVERGLAVYTDDEESAWRYTFRGAIWFYLVGTFAQPLGRLARNLGLSRH